MNFVFWPSSANKDYNVYFRVTPHSCIEMNEEKKEQDKTPLFLMEKEGGTEVVLIVLEPFYLRMSLSKTFEKHCTFARVTKP